MTKRSKTVGSTVPQRQLLNTAGFAPVPTGSGEEQELGVFAGGLSHDPCRASIADTTAAEFASPDWDFFPYYFNIHILHAKGLKNINSTEWAC